MAGHSKWANIKHRKAAQDAKRGKVFTKWIRAITSLARQNPNVEGNAALRLVIDKALEANMSRDTIDKAIARGMGQTNEDAMHRIIYEGYGLDGIAYMVVTLTDNRNRTVAEVRHALDKCGGALSPEGSVAYLFQFASWITVEGELRDEDLESVLALIEDSIEDQGMQTLLCRHENLTELRVLLQDKNYSIVEAETGYRAVTKIAQVSESTLAKHEKLLDLLLDLDDVQEVYHTLDA